MMSGVNDAHFARQTRAVRDTDCRKLEYITIRHLNYQNLKLFDLFRTSVDSEECLQNF